MPEYLHPSVSSKVTDNTNVFATANGTTKLYQALRASIGPDNVVTRVTTPEEYLFKFGRPNLAKYGQAGYNVINWLQAGGEAYVLRVLPADARYANLLLTITKSAAEPKTLTVKLESKATGVSSRAALRSALSTPVDANTTSFAYFIPKGRGAGYNGFGMKLTPKTSFDRTYGFRTYELSFTAKDTTGADTIIEGPFTVSFDPEAKNKAGESVYYAQVVNKYSAYIEVIDNRSAYETVAAYVAGSATSADLSKIDVIFGLERDATVVETLHKNVTWTKTQDISATTYLTNGFDGSWTGSNTPEALLVNAYSGVTDSSITDPRGLEIDVVLDANNAATVKNAMSALATTQRDDTIAILDCGIQADPQGTIDYRKTSISMSSYRTAIFAQNMDVFDSYNGSTITVTSTYFLATLIPSVDNDFGIQWPFVGPRRGVISGFDKINFFPNEAWKESLYLAQINYIERDPKKTNFASQLTSQTANSALSQINNVRVLLKIRRELSKMMADYRMEFNDSVTYNSMTYSANNYLQTWVANRALSSASVSVYASDYDKQQNLVRVAVSVVFNGIIERVAIDITVNR